MNRLLSVLVSLLTLGSLVACAPPKEGQIDYEQIAGRGTLGMSQTGGQVRATVVYFHGMDQTAEVIRTDEKHRRLTEALVRRGYAVVSADADGNAFGNPSSQQSYRDLISAARKHYGSEKVVFLAESMGGLPALMLLVDPAVGPVLGMGGITPLTGFPDEVRSVSYVRGPWGGAVPSSADPLTWPPDRLAGRKFLLYYSAADTVIPAGGTARDFAARFGAVASIDVVDCQGGHVADDCFQPAGFGEWVDRITQG